MQTGKTNPETSVGSTIQQTVPEKNNPDRVKEKVTQKNTPKAVIQKNNPRKAPKKTIAPNTGANKKARKATTDEEANGDNIQRSTKQGLADYTEMFRDLYNQRQLTHNNASRLYYKSSTQQFFQKKNMAGESNRRELCPNVDVFDRRLVEAARELPDKWVGPPLGDVGYGDAHPTYARKS